MNAKQKDILREAIIKILESTGMTLEEAVAFLAEMVETGARTIEKSASSVR